MVLTESAPTEERVALCNYLYAGLHFPGKYGMLALVNMEGIEGMVHT